MKVSVIIPTYNGAHKVKGVLRQLELQTHQPDEVIVVIDGSTDNTAELLKKERYSFSTFKIIEQENGGRSKVRNRGAKEASGELLIFFDDDMLPEPVCIHEHTAHHKLIADSILTGGLEDKSDTNSSDFLQYKSYLSRRWLTPLISLEKTPLPKEKIFLTAANFSIQKNIFFQLQGFDAQLTDAEDFDLAVRAYQQNISLYYNQLAFAWHNDPITGRAYIKRLRDYRASGQRLRAFKPELYSNFPLHKLVMPTGIKKVVFLFFAKNYWVSWLDRSGFKKLIPKIIRYKIYDLITTANGVYFTEKVLL